MSASNEHIKVSFLVVGAQKSGTSTLYQHLISHPDIEMSREKEVHFFDNEELFRDVPTDYDVYHRAYDLKPCAHRGECTPIYMYWRPSMERIYHYNPQMKIIAILRNPIERAFSHWNMELNRCADDIDFASAIRTEPERCKAALPLQHRVFSYVDRGFYTAQIQRIWRYFPRQQTLFIRMEELQCESKTTLNKIASFLNLDDFVNIEPIVANANAYSSPMHTKDIHYLLSRYQHEIAQLQTTLGWDCSDWFNA